MFVARDGRALGVLGIADPVRPGAREAVAALRQRGLEVWLMSGDSPDVAEAVARQVGIEHVLAEVLPADKQAHVAALQARAVGWPWSATASTTRPALAQADLGVAIGTGADVAIEASDVTLVGGDPRLVVSAIDVSRATLRVIRQNLFWAFAYNVLLIPVAMGVLYPIAGITLDPVLAAAAMALSSTIGGRQLAATASSQDSLMEFGYRRLVLPSPRHPASGGAGPLRTRVEPLKRPRPGARRRAAGGAPGWLGRGIGQSPSAPPPVGGSAPVAPLASVAPAVPGAPRVRALADKEVFGFLPYWELGGRCRDRRPGQADHARLVRGRGGPQGPAHPQSSDGTVPLGYRGWTDPAWKALMAEAQAKGVRVVLTVERFSWDAGARAKTIKLLQQPQGTHPAGQRDRGSSWSPPAPMA